MSDYLPADERIANALERIAAALEGDYKRTADAWRAVAEEAQRRVFLGERDPLDTHRCKFCGPVTPMKGYGGDGDVCPICLCSQGLEPDPYVAWVKTWAVPEPDYVERGDLEAVGVNARPKCDNHAGRLHLCVGEEYRGKVVVPETRCTSCGMPVGEGGVVVEIENMATAVLCSTCAPRPVGKSWGAVADES